MQVHMKTERGEELTKCLAAFRVSEQVLWILTQKAAEQGVKTNKFNQV